MKKHLPTIWKTLTLLLIGGVALVPHAASADVTSLITGFAVSGINNAIAGVANFFLMFASWLVAITGTFLSISVNLTTHIKDVYTSVTGIQSVWVTVRDLSSMFIIFVLLYYSIMTIVGKAEGKAKELIVKIFLAGILINFSLFFARVAIDASNLVSLQFYNAIAPNTQDNLTIGSAFSSGGLSNVLMNSLKLPTIYKNNSVLKGADVAAGIGFAAIGGIIMMVTAALSFLAAGIAFIARTGILLFCMALSPLYFAGMIFPQIKAKVSDRLMAIFTGQLIFMPVYLFLLYIALRVISDPMFMKVFNPGNTPGANEGSFGPVAIGVIVQYVIAIIFINVPLMAAISLSGTGGWGMKWAPQAHTIAKKFGGFIGQHTLGRAAKNTSDAIKSSSFAARNPSMAVIASKGLGKVSGASLLGEKGGYDKRMKDYSKAREDYGKKLEMTDKQKKISVAAGLALWDSNLKQKTSRRDEVIDKLRQDDLTIDDRKKYEKEALELSSEIKAREKAKKEGTEVTYLETDALNRRKMEYAKNLEGSRSLLYKKARKDAAEAIRKELKKGKKDKAVDAIKDLLDGTEKGDKEEGGGEDKGEKK